MNFGPKIVDTVKGKLSLSKRVLQVGGVEKVFKQSFSVGKREKLVKALQCNISTTAGPISGMLFISTEKIAFHSDKPINITSPKGNQAKVPYKVIIDKIFHSSFLQSSLLLLLLLSQVIDCNSFCTGCDSTE